MKENFNKLKKDLKYCLGNETGSPYIEYIVVVAVSMCVGAGIFLFGRKMNDWFKGSVNNTIDGVQTPPSNEWRW